MKPARRLLGTVKNAGRTLEMLRKQGAVRVRFAGGEIVEVEFPPPAPEVSAGAAPVPAPIYEPPQPEPKRSDLDALDDLPEYSS